MAKLREVTLSYLKNASESYIKQVSTVSGQDGEQPEVDWSEDGSQLSSLPSEHGMIDHEPEVD